MNLTEYIEAFILTSDPFELCIAVSSVLETSALNTRATKENAIWLIASLFPFAEEKQQVRKAILNCTLSGRNKQDEDILESDDEEE